MSFSSMIQSGTKSSTSRVLLRALPLLCSILIIETNGWLLTSSVALTSSSALRSSLILSMSSQEPTNWDMRETRTDEKGDTITEFGEDPVVPYAAIVGSGRIGGLLASAGNCDVLGREDIIDANSRGPILLATRNDALETIIDKCPENRRKDLVFMQNGYLDEFLEAKGLLDNTQVLLYLSVTSKGAEPVDGVTTACPEGMTAAMGEWAIAFADRLDCLDLKCNVVKRKEYRAAMFEKLMWISTYMLVGAAKGCKTVGEAGSEYIELVAQVVAEMVDAVSAKERIEFEEGTLDRLKAYTEVVMDFPCAVKEFEWRNKYFWDLGDAVPTHNALLRECADKGILGFDLPTK